MLVDTQYLSSSIFSFFFSFLTLYVFFLLSFFELLLALGTSCLYFFSSLSFFSFPFVQYPLDCQWLNKRAGLTVMLEQPSLRLWTGQEHTFSIFFLFITACVLFTWACLLLFFLFGSVFVSSGDNVDRRENTGMFL